MEDDLDVLIEKFDDELSMVLDKHVPIKTMKITDRKKGAWFYDEVKEAKCKMRREKIWKHYKQQHQWISYKTEKDSYNRLLRNKR